MDTFAEARALADIEVEEEFARDREIAAEDAAEPAAEPGPERRCPECLKSLPPRQKGQRGALKRFCCNEHKNAYQSRMTKIGRAMAPAALAWRQGRNYKDAEHKEIARDALKELCRILDGQAADDREQGRMPGIDYFAEVSSDGKFYMDRQR